MYPRKRRQSRIQVFREVHSPSPEAVRQLTQAGGLNRFGEPNYRAVWSESRLSFVGGNFEDRDEEGYLVREVKTWRWLPKYPISNRWLIEQWLAPEKYGTPETWWRDTREWGDEGNLPQLGPYPSRGDYELACVLETPAPERGFVQLTGTLIEDFFWQLKLARLRSYTENVLRARDRMAREKRDFVKRSHEELNEATMPVANDGMMVTVL